MNQQLKNTEPFSGPHLERAAPTLQRLMRSGPQLSRRELVAIEDVRSPLLGYLAQSLREPRSDDSHLVDQSRYIEALEFWNRTTVAQTQHEIADNVLTAFLSASERNEIRTHLDFGPGDGILLNRLLRTEMASARQSSCHPDINVILVDKSEQALNQSREVALNAGIAEARVSLVAADVVAASVKLSVLPFVNEYSVCNLSSCIHEVAKTVRWAFIDSLLQRGASVLVSELEGGHGNPLDRGQLGYAKSIARFYEGAIAAVDATSGSNCAKAHCINFLLIPEVVRLLRGIPPLDMHYSLRNVLTEAHSRKWKVVAKEKRAVGFGHMAFGIMLSR
jgi:hypothetical protein